MRDYFCSRSTMQLPSTENNVRQLLLHQNTSFLVFSINELKIVRVKKIARARTSLRLLPHQYVLGNPIDVLLLAVHRFKE